MFTTLMRAGKKANAASLAVEAGIYDDQVAEDGNSFENIKLYI